MVLTLPISSEIEARLTAKATAAGVDVPTYVARIVEQSAKSPLTLKEISGPVADDFALTGMTEDELGELLEDVKHEMRLERRAGKEK
jgi:tRNA A-37 threonylcarbamoyl transferase component Bud32